MTATHDRSETSRFHIRTFVHTREVDFCGGELPQAHTRLYTVLLWLMDCSVSSQSSFGVSVGLDQVPNGLGGLSFI